MLKGATTVLPTVELPIRHSLFFADLRVIRYCPFYDVCSIWFHHIVMYVYSKASSYSSSATISDQQGLWVVYGGANLTCAGEGLNLGGMDVVDNGDAGLPEFTIKGDGSCECGSPPCGEEICINKYTIGTVIQDMSIGDINVNSRSPGLPHQNKLSRQVMKQQLKELLIRSNMILQNSIRLQGLSEKLLQNSIRMRDFCICIPEKESLHELNEQMPQGNDSMGHQVDSRTQETIV
jgi:hypothetical protein